MKFECKWIMEINDLELLEMVNDSQDCNEEPQFNTLDDIPEQLMCDIIYSDYLEEEINNYLIVPDVTVKKL